MANFGGLANGPMNSIADVHRRVEAMAGELRANDDIVKGVLSNIMATCTMPLANSYKARR